MTPIDATSAAETSTCPPREDDAFRELAQLLGARWTLLILRQAFAGTTRFNDFRAALRIPPESLVGRLNALLDAGLMERRNYTGVSRPRAEYHLTPDGLELAPVIVGLAQWCSDRSTTIAELTIPFERESTKPVRAVLIDDAGRTVDPCHVGVCTPQSRAAQP
jgi:DNA-binding HxlR family transcriptional regulator